MAKAKDLRDLSIEELQATYLDQRKKLFQFENEREHARQFEKPHRIRQVKKDIARLLTIITEKKATVS